MKKIALLLAMLLMAATSFTQSSRRTTNADRTATKSDQEKSSTTQTRSASVSQKNQDNKSTQPARTVTTTESHRATTTSKSTSVTPTRSNNTNTQRNRDGAVMQREQTNKPVPNTQLNKRTDVHYSTTNTQNYSDRPAVQHDNYKATAHTVNANYKQSRYTVINHYYSPRVHKENHIPVHPYNAPPPSREFRAHHYIYRTPAHVDIIWTPTIRQYYIRMYPMVDVWNYPIGHHIEIVSSYDALFYEGEIMTVYGKTNEVFYSRVTDEYFIYYGPYYPYQDFTVIVPGYIARRFSRFPLSFFENQHMVVTGLITSFEGDPEIVIQDRSQIDLY